MDSNNLTKIEILEMIKNRQISSEKGYELIKGLQQNNTIHAGLQTDSELPVTMYYKNEWTAADLEVKKDKEALLGHILLFDTDEEMFNALTKQQKAEGDLGVILAIPGKSYRELGNKKYEINPEQPEDCKLLIESLEKQGLMPEKIVHMWSKEKFTYDGQQLKGQLNKSIYSLFYLTQVLMSKKLTSKVRLLYMYTADNGSIQPLYAAAGGFIKTLRLENPKFVYKTVKVQIPHDSGYDSNLQSLTGIIKQELQVNTDEDIEVCYSDEKRFVKNISEFKPEGKDNESMPLTQKGVYLITGGAGGLGLIFAEYLSKTVKAKLVLVGRSELSAEKEKKIKELEALGSEIMYIKADVTKKEDAVEVIRKIKSRFTEINGVLHAAGVHKNGFILKKSKEDMDSVVNPKVFGTTYLDEALMHEKLDFFVLFSSLSSITGKIGQSDYTYSNYFLDSFAEMREELRAKGKRTGKTAAINWPIWDAEGMAQQITADERNYIFERAGMGSLPAQEGMKVLLSSIRDSSSYQYIIIYGIRDKVADFLNQSLSNGKSQKVAQNTAVDAGELYRKTEEMLSNMIADEIGSTPDRVEPEVSFEDYGIDSIVVNHFNAEMDKKISSLPKTLLFECRNIKELTDYMVKNHEQELVNLFGIQPNKQQHFEEKANSSPLEEIKPVQSIKHLKASRQLKNMGDAKNGNIDYEYSSGMSKNMESIAIIGVSGRYPMAKNLEEFWENLKCGKDCVSEVPSNRWDYLNYYDPESVKVKEGKTYCKWGGFIEDVDMFDSLFFNISPREAEIMDPQERLLLQASWEVLEDAGYTREQLRELTNGEKGANVGVFAGVTTYHYDFIGLEEWSKGNMITPQTSPWSIANRISYIFNFNGPSVPIDTACASGLTAIHFACESILKGECNLAIAGGVHLYLHPYKYVAMSQLRMLSPTGRCHSFSADADGFVPGEGVGAFLLKPLSKAVADGDYIYAVIKGTSINHGGRTNGYTVPDPNAQASLISHVLKKSGTDPRTISYIEAHGTGTALGDPIEISGLTKAFREYTSDKQYCAIGSAKSNIGHLESAAGIAGLTKVLLQMKYKQLVPSILCEKLNPQINFVNSPFYVQRELTEWKKPVINLDNQEKSYPRCAGVSSFGAGGSNAHVLVEEYEGYSPEFDSKSQSQQLIILSVKSEDRLRAYAAKMVHFLETCKEKQVGLGEEEPRERIKISLSDMAYTLQVGRETMEERLALLVSSPDELLDKLKCFSKGKEDIANVFRGNSKDDNSKTNLFMHRKLGKELLKIIVNEGELAHLAQLWVSGVEIDWRLFYSNELTSKYMTGTPKRIPLPTYPFAESRFWIPVVTKKMEGIAAGQAPAVKLHAFIDSNESTFYEQCFKKVFTGDEYFIKDHSNILPAAAYLEMIRAAGELADGQLKVRKLKNLVWANPIVLDGKSREAYIYLSPKDDRVEFEVATTDEDGQRSVHAQGKLLYENGSMNSSEYELIDVDAVLKRCKGGREISEKYYNRMKELGGGVGPRFRGLQEFYYNDGEAISTLGLLQEFEGSFHEYALHPTLVDGGLQTLNAFAYLTMTGAEPNYVPFVMGELDILDPDERMHYAYVKLVDGQDKSNKETVTCNLFLLNKQGQVVVKIKELSFRQVPHTAKNKPVQKPEQYSTLYCTNVWEKADGIIDGISKELSGNVLIFGTDEEMLNTLRMRSEASNADIVLVKPGTGYQNFGNKIFEINPENFQDYLKLIETLKNRNTGFEKIIHMWSDGAFANDEEALRMQMIQGVYSVLYLSKAILENKVKNKIKLLYIYKNNEVHPLNSAMSGFIRAIKRENQNFLYKTMEVQSLSGLQLTDLILNEFQAEADDEVDIKYTGTQRWVRYMQETAQKNTLENAVQLRENGVYLITGGAGGLGLLFAEYLSKKVKARLVLTGRSDLTEEKKNRIKEFELLGSEVMYIKADISNKSETEKFIKEVKSRFGEINGVIHSAGVLRDSLVLKKTREEMEKVIAPKVFGTVNLDKALMGEKLDFFVMFSSTTSILGNPGQTDYAFANSFMDNYAELRSKENRTGKFLAINWGLWRDGGMKFDEQSEKFLLKTVGMKAIDKEAGLKAFETALSMPYSQVAVLEGERLKITGLPVFRIEKQQQPKIITQQHSVQRTYEDSLQQHFRKELIQVVCELLKLDESKVNTKENLSEYGFDSIAFTTLANQINEKFSLDVTPASFLAHPTLEGVTLSLFEEYKAQISSYYQGKVDVKNDTVASAGVETKPDKTVTVMNRSVSRFQFNETKKASIADRIPQTSESVAIIGMSGIMPQSEDLDAFWANLQSELNLITEIPGERWDWKAIYGDPKNGEYKSYAKWGGFIKEVDKFDPMFFSISPREAEFMDPQERLTMETAWKTIEDAGYKPSEFSGTNTGVYIGVCNADYKELLILNRVPEVMPTQSYVANRISYFLNLRGPSEPVDTACSSSLVAIHRAVQAIQDGTCGMALAGGVNVITSPNLYVLDCKVGLLSETGKCKTFDKHADGYVRGEGVGLILLKPLSKAEADGDHIYGVIKGSAVNHGGRSSAMNAPNSDAQAEVVVKAYEKSNIDPYTLSYIDAHGTGTLLGDAAEVDGLKKAFKELYKKWNKQEPIKPHIGIGSVKTNIGHLEPAAGISGVFKILLSMRNRKLPASLHFEEFNPYIKLEGSPFYVVNKTKQWGNLRNDSGSILPRRAGVSAFGAGGVNAHVVLEEYLNKSSKQPEQNQEPQIIILSARNADRLKDYAIKMKEFLENRWLSDNRQQDTDRVNDEDLQADIQEELLNIVSSILCINKAEIDINDGMNEFGVDPMRLTEITNRINEKYNIEVTASLFAEHSSIRAASEHLLNMHRDSLVINCPNKNQDVEKYNYEETLSFADMAYTLQIGRESMNERLAIVSSNIKELVEKLEMYIQGRAKQSDIYSGSAKANKEKTTYMFDEEEGQEFLRNLISNLIKNRKLTRLAQLWVSGVEIDWRQLHTEYSPSRISLPSYPFARERYWIPINPTYGQNEQNICIQPFEKVNQSSDSESDNELMELLMKVKLGELGAETAIQLEQENNNKK